ncbi:lysophospholipid acyltransferase family protein [Balneola sp. MJW-20]|uniref:lysophospholipid acyltransferase family protein n=1 Tax=Gracilimonas aurantiaca TaxID=3234185 RepID=UPI0034667725
MRWITAVIKLFSFLIGTLILYSMIMFCVIFSFTGINYQSCRSYLLNVWGKLSCFILGISVITEGEIPKPPFFLISNHLSYIDVFVLFAIVRGIFVAKSDVKDWPLVGIIVSTVGLLFINRQKRSDVTRVNDQISKNINESQGIIVFPEGTTSPGHRILPLKTSLLQYPVDAGIPVHYCTIRYETNENDNHAYNSVCWWGDISFINHFLKFLKNRRTYAYVRIGFVDSDVSDRKSLAEKIKTEMNVHFSPTIDPDWFEENHEFKPVI